MRKMHAKAVGLAVAVAAFGVVAEAQAAAPTALTLLNGWVQGQSERVPGLMKVGNMVFLEGGMTTTGSDLTAFRLGPKNRPVANVYATIDLPCHASSGRLFISAKTGLATIEAPSGTTGTCASLEGVSFSTAALTDQLALGAGWTGAAYGTALAAAQNVKGITFLQGGLSGGTSATLFTLPAAFAAPAGAFPHTNLFGDTEGYLATDSTGALTTNAAVTFSDAEEFTSLDGVAFANRNLKTPLTLQNGWATASGCSEPAVEEIDGVVFFQGCIAGGSGTVATLPPGILPATNVYMQTVVSGPTGAEILVTSSGQIEIDWTGSADPTSFTGLDGAYYVVEAAP